MDSKLNPYIDRLKKMLPYSKVYPRATLILDHVYLGSEIDAKYRRVLKQNGITHIINCAENYVKTGAEFYKSYGSQAYLGFSALDTVDYNMMQHFEDAYDFMEDARKTGGKVLVHCVMGINRSAVLVIAYLMIHKNMGPLSAAKFVKEKREGALMYNLGFQRQLVKFADERGLLEKDKDLLDILE